MPSDEDTLKSLLKAEVEADRRKYMELREQLEGVRRRLLQGQEYLRGRFGIDIQSEDVESSAKSSGKESTLLRKSTHARLAAIALTEFGLVNAPLKLFDIYDYFRKAGFGKKGDPSHATFVSSIKRSPLFQQDSEDPKKYRLVKRLRREEVEITKTA
jgi:hypothetical protein